MKLEEITKHIDAELKEFERYFRLSMKSNVALLDKIMYYIVQRKGKQVRPMFVFLSAKLCGEVNPATYVAASLVELLHTASLVHDDVVDDSYERRGFFSVNALLKNKIAVLVGDYLLTQGLQLALKNNAFKILEIVSNAFKEISEGELLQIEKARRLDIKEEIYYDIIRQKTASLIAAACAVGASSTTKDENLVEKIASLSKKPIIRLDLTQSISEISNCEMFLDNNYLDFKSIINILATKKSILWVEGGKLIPRLTGSLRRKITILIIKDA